MKFISAMATSFNPSLELFFTIKTPTKEQVIQVSVFSVQDLAAKFPDT
jgi:hypothetical protein